MKRTKEEVFIDNVMGIDNITLHQLYNSIDYNNYTYIFEDYFDSPAFKDDYQDMYYIPELNQYVAILKLQHK